MSDRRNLDPGQLGRTWMRETGGSTCVVTELPGATRAGRATAAHVRSAPVSRCFRPTDTEVAQGRAASHVFTVASVCHLCQPLTGISGP